jgi:hypothetical protein
MTIDRPEISEQPEREGAKEEVVSTAAEKAIAIAFAQPTRVELEASDDMAPVGDLLVFPDVADVKPVEAETTSANKGLSVESAVTSKASPSPAPIEPKKAVPQSKPERQESASQPEVAPKPKPPQEKPHEDVVATTPPEAKKAQPSQPKVELPDQPATSHESVQVESSKTVARKDPKPSESKKPTSDAESADRVSEKAEESGAELATGHEGGDGEPPAERPVPGENDESPEEGAAQEVANAAATDIVWAAATARVLFEDYIREYPPFDAKADTPEATEAYEAVDNANNEYRFLLLTTPWQKAAELHPLLEEIRQLQEEYEIARELFDLDSPGMAKIIGRTEDAKERFVRDVRGTENERITAEERPKGEAWLRIPENRTPVEHLESLFLRLYEPY